VIEPGHDAWVVGDDPVMGFEFESAETYARDEWLRSYAPTPASMFLDTTSRVFCSSAVGLNSTTSVPA